MSGESYSLPHYLGCSTLILKIRQPTLSSVEHCVLYVSLSFSRASHEDRMWSAAFSPDRKRIVTGVPTRRRGCGRYLQTPRN
jgi:hypothetical protein